MIAQYHLLLVIDFHTEMGKTKGPIMRNVSVMIIERIGTDLKDGRLNSFDVSIVRIVPYDMLDPIKCAANDVQEVDFVLLPRITFRATA